MIGLPGGAEFVVVIFLFIVSSAIYVWPAWMIASRAGLPAQLSLTVFIPGAGLLVFLFLLAFLDWPAASANERVRTDPSV